MPTQVQFRRANTANTAVFTGANGELTVDTDKHVLVIHDGITAGGWPLAREASPSVTGVFTVTGNTILTGNLAVSNVANFSNNVIVAGNVSVQQQLMVTGPATFSNNVVISGNLTVTGTQTYVNTTILQVSDNIITLNSDVGGAPTEDAGIEVNRGSSANVAIHWNETSDVWEMTEDGSTYYRMLNNNAPSVTQLTIVSNTFQFGTTSQTSNGYSRLSGGVIMQWGMVNANNTTGGDITFPLLFPNNLWSLTATSEEGTFDITYHALVIASNTSTANVRTGNAATTTVRYVAIGN